MIFVYSGLPGAGKSFIIGRRHPGAIICSTDDYAYDKGNFMPEKIGEAHGACFARFIEACQTAPFRDCVDIVVDNTNTTAPEIAPYMLAAQAYKLEATIITVFAPPEVAQSRNIHGVSKEIHGKMAIALASRELMPWWDASTIISSF
ncbi:MAG: AAA family ATPase [bacterium]|nr:AAA family ATPase [bacterium]